MIVGTCYNVTFCSATLESIEPFGTARSLFANIDCGSLYTPVAAGLNTPEVCEVELLRRLRLQAEYKWKESFFSARGYIISVYRDDCRLDNERTC